MRRSPVTEPRLGEATPGWERRGWRLVVALSATTYLVGSHWPRLEMEVVGGGTGPSPDKILHFVAFLLLAVPAWWTGWFRSLPRLWIAGVLFALFDESTQWLLPIERDFTLEDLLCDACGVTAAVAILAATRPLDDPRSRAIASQRQLAESLLLGKASNWMTLAATAALGGVVAVPVATMAADLVRIEPRAMAVGGAAIGIAVAGLAGLESGIRAIRARLRDADACPACGSTTFEGANCGECGRPRDPHAWFVPPGLPPERRLDAAWWPLLRALVLAGAAIGAMGVLGLETRWLTESPTTARVVDLTVLVVALAWGVRVARVRIAERGSGMDRRCVRCGHDLRGAAAAPASGLQRCPECGADHRADVGGPRDSTTSGERATMSE